MNFEGAIPTQWNVWRSGMKFPSRQSVGRVLIANNPKMPPFQSNDDGPTSWRTRQDESAEKGLLPLPARTLGQAYTVHRWLDPRHRNLCTRWKRPTSRGVENATSLSCYHPSRQ